MTPGKNNLGLDFNLPIAPNYPVSLLTPTHMYACKTCEILIVKEKSLDLDKAADQSERSLSLSFSFPLK